VKKIALPNGAYITNVYDGAARLLATTLKNAAHTPLNSHAYGYNLAHQRTDHTRTDGSQLSFSYDNLGQLTVVRATNASGTILPGETKGYRYDAAGNLNVRTNSSSGNTTTFTVNVKNELTAVGGVSYYYDANGNLTLTSDYRSYSYDAENQLTKAEQYQVWKTEFSYDGLLRLRKRLDYSWNAGYGQWQLTGETRYVYDGRRVIQERNGSNVPTVAYTRGSDLSGTLEGAGGIGGLLARSHGYSGGSWSTHNYYHADGAGNVTYLVSSGQGMAASYRYDAYGNTVTASGSLAGANVYRFSSKEFLVNSGLSYYGYRFYDPNLQRWLNRDPIGERGPDGPNLYPYVLNNPINNIDSFGLWSFYKWLYTGDGNISDEIYEEALDDAADYANCYMKCMADVNKKGLALAAGAVGASPVPKPLVGVWPGPRKSFFTSKTRIASIVSRGLSGNSAATKALNQAAQGVKRAPGRAAARGGVAAVCIAETAAAAYCAKKCASGGE
jgi:RHS repeat-associated protein